MKKIIILLTICIMVFAALNVYAAIQPSDFNDANIINPGMDKIENLGDRILAAFLQISYIVSISVLMYIGIKLMIASPSEKAQIKSMMVPYIVGASVAFTTTTIVTIIVKIANQMTPS